MISVSHGGQLTEDIPEGAPHQMNVVERYVQSAAMMGASTG